MLLGIIVVLREETNNHFKPEPSGVGDGFMNIPDGIDEELPFN